MIHFTNAHMLGLIPTFLSELDPRPAKEQIDSQYAHGGGWKPWSTLWTLSLDWTELLYPNDPPMSEVGRATLRDETIIVYECAFTAIIQPDGSFEVGRLY